MSGRRHRGHIAPWSPPRRLEFGGVGGNRCFSRSYRSRSPVRADRDPYIRHCGDELDRYRPLGRERRYADARTRSPLRPRTCKRDEYEMNRRFLSLNRSTDSALPKPDRFIGAAPVRRGDFGMQCMEERDVHFEKLCRFSESLSRKESTFMKFQWDNLLPDKSTNGKANAGAGGSARRDFRLSNSNGERNGSGKVSGFSDLGVIPMENGGSRASSGYRVDLMSGRKGGLIERGGYVSPLGKLGGETQRTKFSSLSLSLKSPLEEMQIVRPRNATEVRDGMKQNMVLDNHQYTDISRVLHVEEYSDYGSTSNPSSDPTVCGSLVPQEHPFLNTTSASLNHESLQQVDNSCFERDSGDGTSGSCGGDFKRLAMRYGGLYETESSLKQEHMVEKLGIHNTSDMIRGRKCRLEVETSRGDQESESYYDLYAFDGRKDMKPRAGEWTDKDLEQLFLSENSSFCYSKGVEPARTFDVMRSPGKVNYDYPLLCRQRDIFSKPVRPSKRDMEKRLGTARNIKQRLGPVPNLRKMQGPALNVKHCLGPSPHSGKRQRGSRKQHKELPWMKVMEQRCLENYDSSIVTNGPEASYVKKKKNAKTEPPEYSGEFMQLVQCAFLKVFKFLNENSAKRRRYMDQGVTGVLKCMVCGSNSEEFMDTSGLAQHAFTSCQVGYRAEHLGLHKALCVLMGWSCMHMPKGQWVQHMLPDSEALSIREDLIIWPPVVIVHNSSVTSDNPGERMIVSVEQLGAFLRETGFGQGMTNICWGKAANHSTMVVNFCGTFSGLLEAERLHKHYVANKLGRAEFQKFSLNSSMRSSQETQSTPADKGESILYGYLGIAGDFDKLGIETKKQCVVKSKKEIEAVAEASFNI